MRDHVGMVHPRGVADLTEEAIEYPGPTDQVAADDFQHLIPAHEPVVGEVDGSHAPLAEPADNLVVGMLGQSGGRVSAVAPAVEVASSPSMDKHVSEDTSGSDGSARPSDCAADPESPVGRHFCDTATAVDTRF